MERSGGVETPGAAGAGWAISGAIPVQMVAVLAWLDPETGEYTMGVVKALSSRPDQDLGLLEMAKYNLLRRHED